MGIESGGWGWLLFGRVGKITLFLYFLMVIGMWGLCKEN